MSIAVKTTVPHNPMAAAPAMPSTCRASVSRPGRRLTAIPAVSTISASSRLCGTSAGTCWDTARNATTAAAVSTPIWVPPTMTVRKSERSAVAGVAVADMRPRLLVRKVGFAKSKRAVSAGKHSEDCNVRHRPSGQGPIHPALMLDRGEAGVPRVPGREHAEPHRQRHTQRRGRCPRAQHDRGPHEQRKRHEHAGDRDAETPPHAEDQRQGPIAPPAVFVQLIQLGERIEPREQGAKAEQEQGVNEPNPHILINQSTPATALKRNGGTEYRTDIAKQSAYTMRNAGGRVNASSWPPTSSVVLKSSRYFGIGGGAIR